MHVLALDLGTSGAKAALIDLRTGETTAACSQPHPTHTLPGGGVEQGPDPRKVDTGDVIRKQISA